MTQVWVVSLLDVVAHPAYHDGASLDKILHSLGMDITKGYVDDGRWQQECKGTEEDYFGFYHRSLLTGEIGKCPRYVGEPRRDGKWDRFMRYFDET
jgi:hypothetical protein